MSIEQIQGCPVAAPLARTASFDAGANIPASASASTRPTLVRISEIVRNCDPASALGQTAAWARDYLARPHPQLGRKGSVCPFVPLSLAMDSIWLAEVTDATPSFESISAIITEYHDLFLATEPTRGPEALQKSFLLVFPTLDAATGGSALVDTVQRALKKKFVDSGLMLGEFHMANECTGLRNIDFRPFRSPVPLLGMRHMVESDLPFLVREDAPAKDRSLFLRSYLARMGSHLSATRFDQVLDSLVSAEIEVRDAASGTPCVHASAQQSMGVAP
jgi:hypothetical protein